MAMMNTSHGRGLRSCGGSGSSSGKNQGGGGGRESTAAINSSGLRVLVVDDDPTCLVILKRMLTNCLYEVTICNRAETALSLLRNDKHGFDIVISDVHMPDMDGFKLLEHIALEMDLPVIMISADDSKSGVLKGVTRGAVDYLIKPVRMQELKNIWQHVVRKKKTECSIDNIWNRKKRRVVWDDELRQQFLAAVTQLGIETVPKKIWQLMNVPGLTRDQVASHLQQYRRSLQRLGGVPKHQGDLKNSLMRMAQDTSFDTLSTLDEFDIQTLTGSPSDQLPAHSLSQLQASKSGSPVSNIVDDESSFFSFDKPATRSRVLPTCYTNIKPQNTSSSMYFNNYPQELPVNCFPLASRPGQEDVNCSEAGFTTPSYDTFSNRDKDWGLQRLGIALDTHQDAVTVPLTNSGAYPSSSLAVAATDYDHSKQQMPPPSIVPRHDGSAVRVKKKRGIVDRVVNMYQDQSSDQEDTLSDFGF